MSWVARATRGANAAGRATDSPSVDTHPFKLLTPPTHRVPVIAHVPHASTVIPPDVRKTIVLNAPGLRREIVRLTDWHAHDLFSWIVEAGGSMFVNCLSRFVFDPERFADDVQEPMATKGQGVVYTLTTDGTPLAEIDPAERKRRIETLYDPYHEALAALVDSMLVEMGSALIIDCHSFPSTPMASELDQAPNRPDICIGTDSFHTPVALADSLKNAFEREGLDVRGNTPFAGTLVPMKHYRSDDRVTSIMIEIRRDLYCDEVTGERTESYHGLRQAVQRAVRRGLAQAVPGFGLP